MDKQVLIDRAISPVFWFHEGELELVGSISAFLGGADAVDVEEGLFAQAFDRAGGRFVLRVDVGSRGPGRLARVAQKLLGPRMEVVPDYVMPTAGSIEEFTRLLRQHLAPGELPVDPELESLTAFAIEHLPH